MKPSKRRNVCLCTRAGVKNSPIVDHDCEDFEAMDLELETGI